MLPQFELIVPETLEEALEVLYRLGPQARILAGGTDVLVQMRGGQSRPRYLVDIKKLDQLRGIQLAPEQGLMIGALTTHRELELSPLIRDKFAVLHDGVSRVGSVQIRNRATIGGNICNALPSADSAAPLVALGARVRLRSLKGEREVALEEFFLGPRQTVLTPGEMLTHIMVPGADGAGAGAYIKFTRRKAMDLALLGVAFYLETEADVITCRRARIALATAAPTPIRIKEAEAVLVGQALTDSRILQEAGEVASRMARPRSSWRSSENYRRHLIKVLVPRAARLALARIQEGQTPR